MMETHGSYIVEADGQLLDKEIDRLSQQVELTWPKEREVFSRLLLAERADILDLGCGPGFFSERLAQAYPSAYVVGMDQSLTLLNHARRLQQRFDDRLLFVAGALPHDPIAERRFDLVVCRYVLQHLEDPEQAVRQIRSMLKPGGSVVLIDVDADLLGLSDPWNAHLAPIYRRAGIKRNQMGGSRAMGRFLYRFLDRAGFSDISLEAIVVHSDETDLALFDHQMNPELLSTALFEGLISSAEYAFVCTEYERFLCSPSPLIIMLSFVAIGH